MPTSGEELRQRWVEELHELGHAAPTVATRTSALRPGLLDRNGLVELALVRLGARRSAWNAADDRGGRYASEVLSPEEAPAVAERVTTVQVDAGEKVFKAAQEAYKAAGSPLRLDNVGFARAVLYCLDHEADAGLRATTMANFEQLFTLISKAQRQAVRSNSRERVRRTLSRYKNAFLRDHPTSALRRDAESLLEDIESQLIEVNEETGQVRASIRMIRSDSKLAEEPGAGIDDYAIFEYRLEALSYGGLQAVQTLSEV